MERFLFLVLLGCVASFASGRQQVSFAQVKAPCLPLCDSDTAGSDIVAIAGVELLPLPVKTEECDPEYVEDALQVMISADEVEVAVSTGCSAVIQAVVDTTAAEDMVHITYAPTYASIPTLTGADLSFQMYPAGAELSIGLAGILSQFGWRRIAVISEGTDLESVQKLFSEELFPGSPDRVAVYPDLTSSVQTIKDADIRVVVMDTHLSAAREILCEASSLEMTHPEYVWITPGWYSNNWWPDNCVDILNRSLVVSGDSLNSQDNAAQFNSTLAAYASDSVLALAMALDLAWNDSADVTASEIAQHLRELSFDGATGHVEFTPQRTRKTNTVNIQQYREGAGGYERVGVASVQLLSSGVLEFSYEGGENDTTLWPGGTPPIKREVDAVAVPLAVVYFMLATAGVGYAIVCAVFNCYFRKRKVIRLTSPNLNYIICIGAIIFYSSVYFTVAPSKLASVSTFLCNATLWTGAIGISVLYGTIQAKMFRVYIIFKASKKSVFRKFIKDWQLLIYVMALVLIDLILLTTVTAIPGARSIGMPVLDEEHGQHVDDDGVIIIPIIHDCRSSTEGLDTYWFIALFSYKFVLQLVATVLALLICALKVNVKSLNDSREIQTLTYFNMAMFVIVIALAFAVSNYKNAKAAVNGLVILITATITLSMIFIPKMISLYKDPHGKRIFHARGQTIAEAHARASVKKQKTNEMNSVDYISSISGSQANSSKQDAEMKLDGEQNKVGTESSSFASDGKVLDEGVVIPGPGDATHSSTSNGIVDSNGKTPDEVASHSSTSNGIVDSNGKIPEESDSNPV